MTQRYLKARIIMDKCPRQDPQHWKAEDVFEIECPKCKEGVEFFRDEREHKCHKCGETIVNPKAD
jgi:ribosomal protein S27E